jgi:hypothetical protein
MSLPDKCRIRPSLLGVLHRIRESSQLGRTALPNKSFSEALNAVGEHFVDLLLARPRKGRWWLGPDGAWQECIVQRWGQSRETRVFRWAENPSWREWFPEEATRLGDPLTGPDHVVAVEIPASSERVGVVLDQKLRLGRPGDAIASSRTYMAHLLAKPVEHRRPNASDDTNIEAYCQSLLRVIRTVLCNRLDGLLTYSGKVPHVVFASVFTEPHLIYVTDSKETQVTCSCAGFLAPIIDRSQVKIVDPVSIVIRRAAVRLWIGLDDLLGCCDDNEVEMAWAEVIRRLTDSICSGRGTTISLLSRSRAVQ